MNADNGPELCQCRLLIIGGARELRRFNEREEWSIGFSEVDPLELSSARQSWQFSATAPPLSFLRRLSARWPSLRFFLDYETERRKGLASFRKGKSQHRTVRLNS